MLERPLVTVGGLIIAPDGEILLVRSKKWHDLYSLPGGKVELGETREAAFIREVWEETHLKICNLRFALVQDCIFSEQFWQKRHFIMHDFIAFLDPDSSKENVQLNDEAHSFIWITPQKALKLSLHRECRILIEWYLHHLTKNSRGVIGINQHRISCIVGILPEERQHEQILLVDAKIKLDFSRCFISHSVQDTVDYVSMAQICTELAHQKKYLLLETFAADILEAYLQSFSASWAWVSIQKPSAIKSAHYAFVELERYREEEESSCGHL